MQNITNSVDLKQVILLLEAEQSLKGQVLKQQFRLTYESIKPANLILNTLSEVVASPNLLENVIGYLLGLASGFVSKKVIVGHSGNIFRKFVGEAMKFGISNLVSNHSDGLKIFLQQVLLKIISKKEDRLTGESL